ncbi:MAG: type 1 glutamine amidotransferase [Bacillota bacterium]
MPTWATPGRFGKPDYRPAQPACGVIGIGPEIKICHLYPDLMNLYGDRGNVIALKRRAEWHGLRPVVDEVSLEAKPDFRLYDVIFIGGGQDREQQLICLDFQKVKGSSLTEAVEDDVVLLAICGGYQLLGRYYQTGGGEQLPGIGVIDVRTEAGKKRLIGNVIIETDVLEGGPKTVVGFENHSGQTYLGKGLRPFGRVINGYGNNGEDGGEGVLYRNTLGTYLHGSLLPKNPDVTDFLLRRALVRRHGVAEMRPLDDTVERRAHEAAIRRARSKAH